MKTILFSLLLVIASSFLHFSNSCLAQSLTNVSVLNNSFNPSNITIDLGDTVRWTNSSGLHNVNGTTTTFSGNPESFGNSISGNFTFEHKFMTAGTYNYRCDQHFSMGMTGTITVLPPSELTEQEKLEKLIVIYPNPAEYTISILNNTEILFKEFEMFTPSGKSIMKTSYSNNVNLPDLDNGIYYLLLSGDNKSVTKMVIIE